ncbi:hypothetical protein OE88DRAFT_868034 [Heliocybe sulcata]|uniref:Uncharacterized protein n=1 Tax=Heliocybe sulcata TaxID=5364 RepID=A0A5C3MPF1_9AGAM|nr:hypothetical protein OE88DRAFT_868034 [Heliocybe sulcata]
MEAREGLWKQLPAYRNTSNHSSNGPATASSRLKEQHGLTERISGLMRAQGAGESKRSGRQSKEGIRHPPAGRYPTRTPEPPSNNRVGARPPPRRRSRLVKENRINRHLTASRSQRRLGVRSCHHR